MEGSIFSSIHCILQKWLAIINLDHVLEVLHLKPFLVTESKFYPPFPESAENYTGKKSTVPTAVSYLASPSSDLTHSKVIGKT